MNEPELMPEKDVFGLDKPDGLSAVSVDPETSRRTILFTVILLLVAAAIAAGLYLLQR
jgi:hypothetical protein